MTSFWVRKSSLRRTLLVGSAAYGAGVLVVLLAFFIESRSVHARLSERGEQLRAEQRVADHIVAAAYGQRIAALKYLQAPSDETLDAYRRRGAEVQSEVREYLFQDLAIASRLRVERIKQVHLQFEVAAERAFSQARARRQDDLPRRLEELGRLGGQLEAAVRDFIRDRERQTDALRAQLVEYLRQLEVWLLGGAVLLALSASAFSEVVRRRLTTPLQDLASAVQRVGSGEPTTGITTPRYEEFRKLTASFEAMAERVHLAQRELETRNVELTRTLEDLQRTQDELVHRERLSAMGEMLAELAHELNNPLAAVLGLAELLQSETSASPDPRIRELGSTLVDPLLAEAVRSRDLTRSLLQFGRGAPAALEPVPLASIVGAAVTRCRQRSTNRNYDISISVDPEILVNAEPLRLEHSVMNVVGNAFHALEESGRSALRIHSGRRGGRILLHFDDDGCGFREVEKAFDPFYTTKPPGKGTGLGLPLVHRFLQEFDGSVSVANREEGGARVTFELVEASGPPAPPVRQPRADARPQPPASASQRRVLVVDDEPALREIQRRFLRGMGVEVTLASNVAEALDTLKAGELDLVVTDLRMPGKLTVADLLAWLEQERPRLARTVLLVTGDVSGDLPLALVMEDRVLTKPFNRGEYVSKIARALREPPAVLTC